MTTRTDHALIDLLDASGLTGRGGAAFSTVTKLRAAQQHGMAEHRHAIVGADVGEASHASTASRAVSTGAG